MAIGVESKQMDPDDLEDFLAAYSGQVKRHGVDWAEANLRERRPGRAEIVIAEFRRRIGEPLENNRGLLASKPTGWYYPKADHDSPRWVHARSRLGIPDDVVPATNDSADQIVARLGNPLAENITTRGLVLGHVQSGKTTSFLAVAAKALDNDYDLVIVLAGVHNSLRRQTQERAVRTLVHKPEHWWLGTAVGDFRPDGNSLSSHLAGNGKRGLLVVKKHSTILCKLADWLEKESDAALRKLAVLVIDDEADQAGLDVSTGSELAGVHKQLSRIVNLRTSDDKRRCAYLAYTATPYANILTSQDDYGLYPRDFIFPLDPPPSYVGSRELFGDGCVGSPVQLETDDTDDTDDVLTDGLCDAIRWFVLATAARAGLGKPVDSFNSSMLIHTTQLTEDQKAYRPAIESYLAGLLEEFQNDPTAMRQFYDETLEQVPSRESSGDGYVAETTAAWVEVEPHVLTVLGRLIDRTEAGKPFKEDGLLQHAHSGVIVDNSKVDHVDRLTYSDPGAGEPGVTVIAIGGNTLSRGLTLEGLVCSYFARTARNYDSLMQMGRWFGYRPGYRHLLRIWTTQGLLDWFQELDQVEQDLRRELEWMAKQGFSPDVYGPRIRMSPNMNITRAAAMKSVSKEISYSDHRIDPAWLDLDDQVLHDNQVAARTLAEGLGSAETVGQGSLLFRRVPLERIRAFLRAYGFHQEEKRLDRPSLDSYIDREAENLREWNVVFKSSERGSKSDFEFGGDVGSVGTISRGRVKNTSLAFIQSLVDSNDHRLDFDGNPPAGGVLYRSSDEPPLMVVYAIDPVSTPKANSARVPLDASTTPISVSLTFPSSNTFVRYVTPLVAEIEASTVDIDMGDHQDDR
ncbi:MAG: Z1 domain-containing protein [Ilumatobacter sp.]